MGLLDTLRSKGLLSGQAALDFTRGGLMGAVTDTMGYIPDAVADAMRPLGYNVPRERVIGGSDWWANKLTSPTGSKAETAGRFVGGLLAPGPMELMKAGGILGKKPPGMLSIIAPDTARSLPYKGTMPESGDFVNAVTNTPGANITPDGLVIRIARKQSPHVEGEQAIRTGVFYLPAGDTRIKHYGGKGGYGGTEKFEGDTLLKNPIFVKGATGGKAPENAYDQIMGKGSYEAMRREVLDAIPYHNATLAEKEAAIKPVLSKFGGDPNMAAVIAAASTEGNTLPYAIQEHIVAHAVRNAGFDAVLGYSQKKDGSKFISEVFDVREQTYPSDVLNPQIHDAFSQ